MFVIFFSLASNSLITRYRFSADETHDAIFAIDSA